MSCASGCCHCNIIGPGSRPPKSPDQLRREAEAAIKAALAKLTPAQRRSLNEASVRAGKGLKK